MSTFYLKRGDTRPILQVQLRNPDGSIHDLTGSTDWRLHIALPDGGVFTRAMTKHGNDVDGTVRYVWQPSDWGPDALPPLAPTAVCTYAMEYEVIEGLNGLTFPNSTFDQLQVTGDVTEGVDGQDGGGGTPSPAEPHATTHAPGGSDALTGYLATADATDLLRRGTRAAQPAASAVVPGPLLRAG